MKYGRKYGGPQSDSARGISWHRTTKISEFRGRGHEIRVGRNGATSGSGTVSVKLTCDFVAQPQNYPCVSRISWHVATKLRGARRCRSVVALVILA
jgi:hypothetical protein